MQDRPSAQRVSEGVSRGGAVRYDTWQECVRSWHSACDAGDHDHTPQESGVDQPIPPPPTCPTPTTPVRVRATTSSVPATPTRHGHAVPENFRNLPGSLQRRAIIIAASSPDFQDATRQFAAGRAAQAMLSQEQVPPVPPVPSMPSMTSPSSFRASAASTAATTGLPSSDDLPPVYALRGGHVIHNNLAAAIDDFEAAGRLGPATLCVAYSPRVAANVARGLTLSEAEALEQGREALRGYRAFLGDDEASSQRRRVISQLEAALAELSVGEDPFGPEQGDVDSDSEYWRDT